MKEVGRMKTKELNKGEIIITSQDLHKPIYEFFKRILDVISSVVALIVLSPAFLVTALAVRSNLKRKCLKKEIFIYETDKKFNDSSINDMCKEGQRSSIETKVN